VPLNSSLYRRVYPGGIVAFTGDATTKKKEIKIKKEKRVFRRKHKGGLLLSLSLSYFCSQSWEQVFEIQHTKLVKIFFTYY